MLINSHHPNISFKKIFLKLTLLIIFTAALLNFKDTFANVITIGDDPSAVDSSVFNDGDSALFTGSNSGTLNHTDSEVFISDIQTDNNGVGIINMNSSFQLSTGNVGSSSKAINKILFLRQSIFNLNGDLYATNGFEANSDAKGDLNISQDNTSATFDHIGSANFRLSKVSVGANNVKLSGNIFTVSFNINSLRSVTLSNLLPDNDLGDISMQPFSQLTLNSNANVKNIDAQGDDVIAIASGKQMNVSGNANLSGSLNFSVVRSDSSNSPVIKLGSGNAVIADGFQANVDYSTATFLKVDDQYNIIKSDSGSLTADTSTIFFSDNSILLEPEFSVTNNNALTLTQTIDTSTTDKLNQQDLATADFIITNENAKYSDLVRTELLKIETQEELEDVLENFRMPKNNMLQLSVLSASNQVNNVLDNHTQSFNYQNFLNFTREQTDQKMTSRTRNSNNFYQQKNYNRTNNIWGEIIGGDAKQNTKQGIAGFTGNSAGFVFGVDGSNKNNQQNQINGLAFSYIKSDADDQSFNNQKASINSYQLFLYNGNFDKKGHGIFSSNSLGLSYNQYDTERLIKVVSYQSRAQAKFNGGSVFAKSDIGYNFKIDSQTLFAPIASIKYFGTKIGNYQEEDESGLGFKVENDFFQLFTTDIGGQITGQITPEIYLKLTGSWSHNINNSGARFTTSFSDGGGVVRNQGAKIDANFINFGTEINLENKPYSAATLKYQLQSGRSLRNQFLGIGYKIAF